MVVVESPEFLQTIFLFQSSPQRLHTRRLLHVKRTTNTTSHTVVVYSHFFFSSSFSSRICSLEKTRFSKSFDALGPFLKCETRRFCAFSFLNCLLMMLRRLSAPLRWRSCVSLLLLLFHWVAGELDEFLIAVHTL